MARGRRPEIVARRARERAALRQRILDAAHDILREEGLEGLSVRAIAARIAYSPATLYLHFRDKADLLRELLREGFRRLAKAVAEESAAAGSNPAARHRALGRAYARFALENPGYFRLMFELPAGPRMVCGDPALAAEVRGEVPSWEEVVGSVVEAQRAGIYASEVDAQRGTLFAWALIHGLTSLYLGGHLRELAPTREAFERLLEEAIDQVGRWLGASLAGAASGG